ncbi:MAG TPA: glycosyltransferase [Atribacterota bacterium]|nr:glycosyltransferase [Atribacterota bacterium]
MYQKIFIIDNSPTDELKTFGKLSNKIVYIFNPSNLGFGVAHNIAMRKSIKISAKYHLVLNPDVYFEQGVLEELFTYMENNPDVELVMPKVLYPN